MNEWISVEDDLPQTNEIVLIGDSAGQYVSLGRVIQGANEMEFQILDYDQIHSDAEVTHWRFLPNPPQQENLESLS